jgi:multicomponent Na+:H+ antiporter subunit B
MASLVFILPGIFQLPPLGRYPGPYGDLITALAWQQRQISNAVTAVVFDYRGFDTLGEEFILFASATGISLVLRGVSEARLEMGSRSERVSKRLSTRMPKFERAPAIRFGCWWLCLAVMVFGFSILVHGPQTPGGGFQGGAILVTGLLTLALGWSEELLLRCSPPALLLSLEALGMGGYLVTGTVAVLKGGVFLENFLGHGISRELWSGGSVNLVNISVGIAVVGAFGMIGREFADQLQSSSRSR